MQTDGQTLSHSRSISTAVTRAVSYFGRESAATRL